MGNLKDNIDHYMREKGIESYSKLLLEISGKLGIKNDRYDFVNREKSNFSKMLKGERPLKYEFIVPLEEIFGVSLARLLDEDAYKLPIEKNNVPFKKGFSYYAYLDDSKLYKEEFDLLLTKDGESILARTDEFGKTFLDYVVEYHSINGVRYLHDEYGIKLKWPHNQFEFNKDSGITRIYFDNYIEFARLVADMKDAVLFNDIFDSYNMFLAQGHYASEKTIFCQKEYLEIMLDNDTVFKSILKARPYKYVLAGSCVKEIKHVSSVTYNYKLINPIINNCLRYALEHLDKYRQRAIEILKFGIMHNKKIIDKAGADTYCICNELGGVIDSKRMEWFNCDIEDIAVFVDTEVNDNEINALIKRLPKFENRDRERNKHASRPIYIEK